MIRRFTSAPKPAARVPRVHLLDVVGHRREGRSARRHSARGSRRPRPARSGSTTPGRRGAPGSPPSRPSRPPREGIRGVAHRGAPWSALLASARKSSMTPTRNRRRRLRAPREARGRGVDRGRVAGIVAGEHLEQQRGISDRGGERTDLVERAREGDQAVARDEAVGRLHPTTPQSAAGWRIEPPVSEPSASGTKPAATAAAEPPEEPPGTRSCPRGCASARRRSSPSRSPSRTRRGWSCRERWRRLPPVF
jgi:hypothetical protein